MYRLKMPFSIEVVKHAWHTEFVLSIPLIRPMSHAATNSHDQQKIKKNQVAFMARLPWSDNKDINILTPCVLCLNESASITNSKYCLVCYKELLTNIILKLCPISDKNINVSQRD